jgi:hypothetical protein
MLGKTKTVVIQNLTPAYRQAGLKFKIKIQHYDSF